MSKHNEVLFIEQLCKQSRSARAIFPLTKSKSSSPILEYQVFLAYKYVEKLMEMTFMFKNTKGSYTWYPSNIEVMPLVMKELMSVFQQEEKIPPQNVNETHGNDVYVQKYKRILHVISVYKQEGYAASSSSKS